MKTLISIITLLFPLITRAQVNNAYTLQGKANNPATLTLQYMKEGELIKNSGEVNNGEVKITGTINTKVQASLLIVPKVTANGSSGTMATMVRLWLEPGNIKINNLDSAQKGKVYFTGTVLNDESNDLVKQKLAIGLPFGLQRDEAVKAVAINFIKAHPNSMVSLTELDITLSRGIPDLAIVEPLFNSLSAEVRSSAIGKNYQEKLVKWKTVDISSIAPDFTQSDVKGMPVKLSDYKGKYILIDFWASWCHPCRDENPNLVKQYNLYKDKNFVILSISLDERKSDWLKAIKEDKLPWKQVSDLKRNNEAKVKYGVQSIPENFLVSPDGKIIGKSLRGEELDKKLLEVFGK
jgi:thiol-disulfide isomerase/thioredoxin